MVATNTPTCFCSTGSPPCIDWWILGPDLAARSPNAGRWAETALPTHSPVEIRLAGPCRPLTLPPPTPSAPSEAARATADAALQASLTACADALATAAPCAETAWATATALAKWAEACESWLWTAAGNLGPRPKKSAGRCTDPVRSQITRPRPGKDGAVIAPRTAVTGGSARRLREAVRQLPANDGASPGRPQASDRRLRPPGSSRIRAAPIRPPPAHGSPALDLMAQLAADSWPPPAGPPSPCPVAATRGTQTSSTPDAARAGAWPKSGLPQLPPASGPGAADPICPTNRRHPHQMGQKEPDISRTFRHFPVGNAPALSGTFPGTVGSGMLRHFPALPGTFRRFSGTSQNFPELSGTLQSLPELSGAFRNFPDSPFGTVQAVS